jgi:hypothetical protein
VSLSDVDVVGQHRDSFKGRIDEHLAARAAFAVGQGDPREQFSHRHGRHRDVIVVSDESIEIGLASLSVDKERGIEQQPRLDSGSLLYGEQQSPPPGHVAGPVGINCMPSQSRLDRRSAAATRGVRVGYHPASSDDGELLTPLHSIEEVLRSSGPHRWRSHQPAAEANAAYPSPGTDVLDTWFGITSTLIGVGLVIAGIAVVRARVWVGWPRFVTLAGGVAVFVIVIPGVFAPFSPAGSSSPCGC